MALSAGRDSSPDLLRDVNSDRETDSLRVVSPINAQEDSNLKNPLFICLEKTGFADMYRSLAKRLDVQRAKIEKVPAFMQSSLHAWPGVSEADV
jgi:hypothetical protein